MTALGLGTVQLGLPYGNAVQKPVMLETDAAEILTFAAEQGVLFWDTAAAYGQSEKRIGGFLRRHPLFQPEISTKIPAFSPEICADFTSYQRYAMNSLEASFSDLGLKRLALLQFHQCEVEFLRSKVFAKITDQLLESGICAAIGVSVYDVDQANAALMCPNVSSLQIPVNMVDQRFVTPRQIELYQSRQVRLIARSIFMQGVLVDDCPIPPVKKFAELSTLRQRSLAAVQPTGMTLYAACLSFVLQNLADTLSIALIGADTVSSLASAVESAGALKGPLDADIVREFLQIGIEAEATGLLNPPNWNR